MKYSISGHSSVSPSSQDWLCSLACEIEAIQIETKQDLLPPLSAGCKLENAVSHPGQGGARTRAVKNKTPSFINAANLLAAVSHSEFMDVTYLAPLE